MEKRRTSFVYPLVFVAIIFIGFCCCLAIVVSLIPTFIVTETVPKTFSGYTGKMMNIQSQSTSLDYHSLSIGWCSIPIRWRGHKRCQGYSASSIISSTNFWYDCKTRKTSVYSSWNKTKSIFIEYYDYSLVQHGFQFNQCWCEHQWRNNRFIDEWISSFTWDTNLFALYNVFSSRKSVDRENFWNESEHGCTSRIHVGL